MDQAPEAITKTKLDLGCGKNVAEGFAGVDLLSFGQAWHCDLRISPWMLTPFATRSDDGTTYPVPGASPIPADSVDEVHSSHFVEHLTGVERVAFWNELHRVLKKGAQARIIVPNWSHACAYGDPTHQWPPMSEWAIYYLNKAWRDANAPHVPLTCDFDFVTGGSWDAWLEVRPQDTRTFAMQRYVNSWRDLIINLTKR